MLGENTQLKKKNLKRNLIGLRIQMEHGLLKLQKTRKKFFLFFCFEISTLEKN